VRNIRGSWGLCVIVAMLERVFSQLPGEAHVMMATRHAEGCVMLMAARHAVFTLPTTV
jgi:hypothetical protein